MQRHVQVFVLLNEKQVFLYFNLAYLKKLRKRDQVTNYKIPTAVRLVLHERANSSVSKNSVAKNLVSHLCDLKNAATCSTFCAT
jgi:hypothetical protein